MPPLAYVDLFHGILGSIAAEMAESREHDRQAADSSEEHQDDQDKAGQKAQGGSDAQGQSHGTDRGRRLEQACADGKPVRRADDEGGGKGEKQIRGQKGDGVPYGILLDPAAEHPGVLPAAEHGQRCCREDRQRRRLHSAGR